MIVGAGVVGLYLAKLLGEQVVLEKNKKLLEKACGGLFSKNIKKLDVDLSESVVNEVRGAKFFYKDKSFEVKKNTTQAFVVDRFKFQESLLKDALDEKNKVMFGTAWKGQEDNYVIGADGALSEVAKSLGIKRKYFYTYQETVQLGKKIDPDFVELHFGEFAPGFFAWLIPLDEKTARLGVGCVKGNPGTHYSSFVKRFDVAKVLKKQAGIIPVFDNKKVVYGNKALVGDAAAQVKASTGGGVVFGMLCAEELKKAVKKENLQAYEKNIRRKYYKDLKFHLLVRKFLNHVNYGKLFNAIEKEKIARLIEEQGDMEEAAKLKKALLRKPLTLAKLAFTLL